MSRRVGLAVVLGFLTLPAIGRAQYGGDAYAPVQAPPPLMPFGQGAEFNPAMSPEWQQLMMQKMAAQEQAAFRQQVQEYQAWAKANPKAAAAQERAYRAQMDPNAGNAARRKKKLATKPAATAPAAKGSKPVAKSNQPLGAESPTKATAATKAEATSSLRAARQGTPRAAAPK